MKLERVPKERAEKQVEALETQKTVWQDIGRRIGALRDTARTLFSYQNPFNERIARSADESVITGNASREASEQERAFVVKQKAAADRFLSKPLPDSYKIPAGDYLFTVGTEEITVPFRGGDAKAFAEAVARRGKEKIAVSTIVVEPKTTSIIVESLVTGSGNRLSFKKDAEKFALETGLIERTDSGERKIELSQGSVRATGEAERVAVREDALTVTAGGSARIPLSPGIRMAGDLTIEYELGAQARSEEIEEAVPPPGPSIPPAGTIVYGGIVIENDPISVPLPPWQKPLPPPRVDDPAVLKLVYADGSSAFLPAVEDDRGLIKSSRRLADFGGREGATLTAIEVVNRNTHRDITLKSVRIFDPAAVGDFKPRNPISTASDAVVVMDGIEVIRPNNDIDDLIPGVTLTVQGTSDRPVSLSVEPDREAAKEAVIELVGTYNRLVAEINVLTRQDDKLIRELTYLSDDERESMAEKMGTMQGDVTLNQLKTSLQRTASSPYPTRDERDLALLSQLGISTDSRKPGSASGVDASRLRGYLEIDEKQLDETLRRRLPAAKELFGNDTDGDLIVDSGFAYSIDTLAKPFVEIGGLVQLKTGTIDTKIAQEKRTIDTLDRQLAAKEADLKRKYGTMEGALNRMERTSSSIDQFSNRNANQ